MAPQSFFWITDFRGRKIAVLDETDTTPARLALLAVLPVARSALFFIENE